MIFAQVILILYNNSFNLTITWAHTLSQDVTGGTEFLILLAQKCKITTFGTGFKRGREGRRERELERGEVGGRDEMNE